MNKKYLISITSILMSASLLFGCAKIDTENAQSKPEETSATEQETTLKEDEPKGTVTLNPLTGLESTSQIHNSRPIAVMINNHHEALPQYGINNADIIFEVPVEGGITRLMAVYENYSMIPDVCSIRSCRYYFPILANTFDAIYLHWGSDQSIALDTLKRLKIDSLDGNTVGAPLFGRDSERKKKYALEHTSYLKGSALKSVLDQKKIRTDINDSHKDKTYFNFLSNDVEINPQDPAKNIVLNFSKDYFSTFTYDENNKIYLKQHSGKPQKDAKTGEQLSFKNVIVLQTTIKKLSYDGVLMNVALESGNGYYISNGGCEQIKWTKPSESSPIKLLRADGTEFSINSGKSYIGIIGTDKSVSIS